MPEHDKQHEHDRLHGYAKEFFHASFAFRDARSGAEPASGVVGAQAVVDDRVSRASSDMCRRFRRLPVRELFAHDRAVLHADNPVALFANPGIVRHQHDREVVLFVEGAQEVHDVGCGFRVQGASRLVGPDDGRVIDERAGNRNALSLTTGKLGRAMVRPLAQAHGFKGCQGPRVRLRTA